MHDFDFPVTFMNLIKEYLYATKYSEGHGDPVSFMHLIHKSYVRLKTTISLRYGPYLLNNSFYSWIVG